MLQVTFILPVGRVVMKTLHHNLATNRRISAPTLLSPSSMPMVCAFGGHILEGTVPICFMDWPSMPILIFTCVDQQAAQTIYRTVTICSQRMVAGKMVYWQNLTPTGIACGPLI